jgi:hypothetical protein
MSKVENHLFIQPSLEGDEFVPVGGSFKLKARGRGMQSFSSGSANVVRKHPVNMIADPVRQAVSPPH